MAYGLDFEEIYYTDHERYDLGVLQTYEIDIDLANEKDFSIQTPEPIIPMKGFWYIQNTEYGGIIDKFETDSDNELITYEGRTFRGILNSHYVDVQGAERTIPSSTLEKIDEQGASVSISATTVTDCLNELLQESQLTDIFTIDAPYVHETVSSTLSGYIVKQGTTLYDAFIGITKSVGFSFVLEYRSDHKVHIIPILIQDYVDYLKGSKYEGIGFKTELDTAVTNHLIIGAIMENGGYRIGHFFSDKNGGIQPYKTVEHPIKDSQYIVDRRNQLLFGVDEVAYYEETTDSVVENFEMLTAVPSDWNSNYRNYFKYEVDEQGNESYNKYEPLLREEANHITSQPADWATNYSNYYTRNWNEEKGDWIYTAISAESILDYNSAVAIMAQPIDWSSNYSEYYYKFRTGTGFEYRPYEGVTTDYFVKMTSKPSDWDSNWSSYYRKIFKKEKKTENGKTKILVDYVKYNGEYYTTCKADDDGKGKKKPAFGKRSHYRKDSVTNPPAFKGNNCYRLNRVAVTPTFDTSANTYFSLRTVEYAPPFVVGEGYQKVYDHYSSMVETAVDFFEKEQIKSSQELELDYFAVNIGDVIGGTDEFTKTNVVGTVSNIEAKIENGLIDLFYKIKIDDYSSALVHGSIEVEESEE